MSNDAQKTTLRAVETNLEALEQRLVEAGKLAQEAFQAMKDGKLNLAIGTALPLEQMLTEAKALYDTAVILARSAQSTFG